MEREVKSSTIGIQDFTLFLYDEITETYGEPIPLTTVESISTKRSIAKIDVYNDNQLFETISRVSNVEINTEFTSLTSREHALLLGWDNDGALKLESNNDISRVFCIAYKRTKANGSIKYVKFLSCVGTVEGEDGETEGENVKSQSYKLMFKAKPLRNDFYIERLQSKIKLEVEDSDFEYDGEGDEWFTSAIPTKYTPTPIVANKNQITKELKETKVK
jgi:phi13 family phage major tail protein